MITDDKMTRYYRQTNGPPDGKRSPSPRDMCNTEGVTHALPIPKGIEGRGKGWEMEEEKATGNPLTVRVAKVRPLLDAGILWGRVT